MFDFLKYKTNNSLDNSVGSVFVSPTTPLPTYNAPSSSQFPATGFTDTVTVSGSAQQLPSHIVTAGGFLENSSSSNNMYVGFSSGVTTGNGYLISPLGQLPILTANTNAYWVIGTTGQLDIIGA